MSITDLNPSQKAIAKIGNDKERDLLPQALGLLGFASLIFAAMPELDLMVSRFFWEPAAGFVAIDNSFLIAFRDANRLLPWVVIGVALPLLIPNPFLKYLRYPPAPHKLLFLLTFFATGPGLGVHLIKILVGRARPKALEDFGGSAVFTPPWELTDQCVRNCSFISGEAASAFALLTLVVFIRPKYTALFLCAVGIVAAGFSFNRVVFGAHFLSDVVISWSLMFVLAVLLWRLFSRSAPQIDALFGSRNRPV
ncbi:phosphatase PAP2 family protein [Agrobacterium sp. a22-2]|uniref:phosphatase PAP2 family protein n=1 Tax=Agrobacterium sp. a22-2 TaxID=2283840 RepID=UPI001444F10D|nr:phosphatase PAP2 family protein [Agrobacterium sp. a22-2]NKN39040.1 phosphatase PAP2 family protein [Agrobacterium sp. a22-2]